jgi:hypothetical protein
MKMSQLSHRHQQAQLAHPKRMLSYLDDRDVDPGGDCDEHVMLTDTPDIHTVTCGRVPAGTVTLTCHECPAVQSGRVCDWHPEVVWLCTACWYDRDTFAEMTAVFGLPSVPPEREPRDLIELLASMGSAA